MIRKVLQSIKRLDPDRAFRRLVLGVSGGADSMALLHSLCAIRKNLGVSLIAVHINHNARGEESDEDAAFVRRECKKLRVKCIVKSVNVKARASRRKISFEMAARDTRYEIFAAEAGSARLKTAVVTAHTMDDQAETVLLKLARGAGSRGLAGIPVKTEMKGVTIIRPMLSVTRDQVMSFLERGKHSWREDSSNAGVDYMRNRVRHRILPLIEEDLNPNARKVLARTAEILREEDAILQNTAEAILEACMVSAKELDLALLRNENNALVRRALIAWLSSNGVRSSDLDVGLISAVEKVIYSRKANASMKVSGGIHISREYDSLRIGSKRPASPKEYSVSLKSPCRVRIPDAGLEVEACRGDEVIKWRGRPGEYPSKATVSRAAVGRKKLTVRSWRPGDRIKPMGMQGTKKIKDILIDLKIPASVRKQIPVVECGGEIIWLPGYRVARGWEVGADERAICLSLGHV